MLYRNLKTGNVIDISSKLYDNMWEALDELPASDFNEEEAPVIEEDLSNDDEELTVEEDVLNEEEAPAAVPKKRGRKKKNG